MPDSEYLPYKAINVFIERDYLEKIIKEILESVEKLPRGEQAKFSAFFRNNVNILGFRNPIRAPLALQINAYAAAFEDDGDVIPYTLTTWARVNPELAEKVQSWLEAEGWKGLTAERTLEDSNGFISDWPEELTFDALVEKFNSAHPDHQYDRNDLILMVLWVSGNLPKQQSGL